MRTKRKVFGTLGALVVAGIVAAVAVAYYGGSGTGTASASAGHAPREVTVTGSVENVLYPGATEDVDIEIALTGPGSVRVGAVTATAIHTSNEPACDPAWFSFTPPAAGQFPAGANVTQAQTLAVTGSLTFIESGTLQDACSDADVTVDLQASPN